MKDLTDEHVEELLSNKVIQVTIVILITIMAFCLAAITILYYIELQHHNKPFYEKSSTKFNNKLQHQPGIHPFTESTLMSSVTNSLRTLGLTDYMPTVNNVKNNKLFPKNGPWIKDNSMPSFPPLNIRG